MPAFNWTSTSKSRQQQHHSRQPKVASRRVSVQPTKDHSLSLDLVALSSRTLDPSRGQSCDDAAASAVANQLAQQQQPPSAGFGQRDDPPLELFDFPLGRRTAAQSEAPSGRATLYAFREQLEDSQPGDAGTHPELDSRGPRGSSWERSMHGSVCASTLDTSAARPAATPPLFEMAHGGYTESHASRRSTPATTSHAFPFGSDPISHQPRARSPMQSPPQPVGARTASWLQRSPTLLAYGHGSGSPPTVARPASDTAHALGAGSSRPNALKRSLLGLGVELEPLQMAPRRRHSPEQPSVVSLDHLRDGLSSPPRSAAFADDDSAFESGFLLDALRPQTQAQTHMRPSSTEGLADVLRAREEQPVYACGGPTASTTTQLPSRTALEMLSDEEDESERFALSSINGHSPALPTRRFGRSALDSGAGALGARGFLGRAGVEDSADELRCDGPALTRTGHEQREPIIAMLSRPGETTSAMAATPAASADAAAEAVATAAPPASPFLSSPLPPLPDALPDPHRSARRASDSRPSSEGSAVNADDRPLQLAREELIGAEYGSFMPAGSQSGEGAAGGDGGRAQRGDETRVSHDAPPPKPTLRSVRTQTASSGGIDAGVQTDNATFLEMGRMA